MAIPKAKSIDKTALYFWNGTKYEAWDGVLQGTSLVADQSTKLLLECLLVELKINNAILNEVHNLNIKEIDI